MKTMKARERRNIKKKVRLILLSIDTIKKQRETVQKETSVKIGFQKYVI